MSARALFYTELIKIIYFNKKKDDFPLAIIIGHIYNDRIAIYMVILLSII